MKKDPQNLQGFTGQFCTKTAVWYYLNRLERQYIVVNKSSKSVQFSNNVSTSISDGKFTLKQGDITLVENDDVFIPALWLQKPSIIAYSKNGVQNKSWTLPEGWNNLKKVQLSVVTDKGKTNSRTAEIKNGKLVLTLEKEQASLIEKL